MADFDETKEREAFESAMRIEGAKDWEFHRLIPQMDSFKRLVHVGRYVMDRTEYKWNGWQLARHQPSAPAWIELDNKSPELHQHCLVWAINADEDPYHVVAVYNGNGTFLQTGGKRVGHPHAWMPLPPAEQ